ncbi:MAG: SGNH/GDSL hydrolase family protein [Planctomycetes bacterium]|jgi:lysophospholipase L1-like esterase|nr:SGNH/GDSL hydrolase family protein [Planctomycetota bacterium]
MNKKKYLIIILAVIVIVGAYLYFSNAYIYHHIKSANLSASDSANKTYIMGNKNRLQSLVYVALGDSLTSGVGTNKYEESFPYLVAEKLAKDNKVVFKHFSYPGDRTSDLINKFLTPAIAEKPDLVTLLIGTNDMHGRVGKEVFENNYEQILARLRKETSARIYVVSVPFLGSNTLILPPDSYYFDQETKAYNEIIKKLAQKYKVNYIDIATPTAALFKQNGPHYAADSFHPSAAGYQLWAKIIYDSINH